MTAAEKQRRYRERKAEAFGNKPPVTKSGTAAMIDQMRAAHRATVAALEARVRELEAALAHERQEHKERRGEGQLTRRRSRPEEFTEVGKLRAEIGKLKSDIFKLKAMLQEEPDAAKLRKKVVDQQTEMASLRRALKRVAKERDEYQARTKPKYREAARLLTGPNYRVIIKAMHPDRSQHVTAAELAAAERVVTGLRPLFIEDR
jgi:chromosome segregation ATPase